MTGNPWHRGLNPEQVQAVDHNYGPLLILAGAGSGKTTVLVARTGRLLQEAVVNPDQALVLTFTNKAARELKHRVQARLGAQSKGLWAGTFHSFGLQILRRYSAEMNLPSQFAVLDQNDCQSLLRELMKEIRITGKDKFDLAKLMELINVRRVKGRFPEQGFDEYQEMAEVLHPKFVKKLEVLGAVDFEGLLLKPVELFQNRPEVLKKYQEQYQQVMVDEFQDTNSLQMKLIDFLIREHRNITVVGDDDQSIYGWRGAEVQNILQFPKLYKPCEVIRLERNYRSTPAILGLANHSISHNKHRHGKVLTPHNKNLTDCEIPELFVVDNEDEESDLVLAEIRRHLDQGGKLSEAAVLYRSNSQGGLIESVLRQNRIEYSVSGNTAFFDRKEIKDILAYLRCSLQPNDVSLRRIINVPSRGIGDASLEKINEFATKNKISFLNACKQWAQVGVGERVGASIDGVLNLLPQISDRIMNGTGGGANMLLLLREMGYRDYLYQTSASSEAGEKRWQIVEIFSRVLDSFIARGGSSNKTLGEFIDAMELRDTEEDTEESREKIQLMTLHAAKGLEFPLVMLLGVEEDLLPHKTLGSNVDEERRLFYVGLTRAKERLILTRCRTRKRYGELRPVAPSRFLLELTSAKTALLKTYENGVRPVSGAQREQLVGDFLSQLNSKKREPLKTGFN
jgi:DNA helicase-2/ATP-dependent DNA helicase PcrA